MFDIARDPRTGDWVFSGNRDLLGIGGDAVTLQRINTRLRVPRGEWLYDVDRDFGSRLYLTTRYPITRTLQESAEIVREALDPMVDVKVLSVEADLQENDEVVLTVNYQTIAMAGEGISSTAPENISALVVPLPSMVALDNVN